MGGIMFGRYEGDNRLDGASAGAERTNQDDETMETLIDAGHAARRIPSLACGFQRVTEPRHNHFRSEQARSASLLNHPMPQNERIDDVPAGHTAPSFHPHWNAAFLHVDQAIGYHETITSGALHETLLVQLRLTATMPLVLSFQA